MKDFDLYKRIISLPDFLINNFGFTIHPKGSSRNAPKLTDGNTTILITKKNQKYTYADINSLKETKSILDFMQENSAQYNNGEKPSLVFVANLLDSYILEGKTVLPEFSNFSLNNAALTPEEVNRNILRLEKTGNNEFLTKRGLSDKTLNHSNFAPSIRYRHIPGVTDKDKFDIAFVMTSFESTRAITYRGTREGLDYSFKGFQGPRSQCLVTSNYDQNQPIEKMLVGESFIDCMAHFELNYKELKDKNIVYLSTEGSVQDTQISLLQRAVQRNTPNSISIIFDNDLYGVQASTKILGKLAIPSSIIKDFIHSPSSNLYLNLSTFEVPICGDKEKTAKILLNIPSSKHTADIKEHVLKLTRIFNDKQTGAKDHFTTIFSQNPNAPNQAIISFPNNLENWKTAKEFVHSFKFSFSKQLSVEFPKSKDFNQDLQNYKGIPTNKPHLKDNPLFL